MTEIILLVALLSTESSYKNNLERPASTVADTVQFAMSEQSTWRIRTYAIDHDIHTHSIGTPLNGKTFGSVEAEQNIRKTYGDVLNAIYVLHLPVPFNDDVNKKLLIERGLPGTIESGQDGLVFYNPDRSSYRSKTTPK